MNRTDLTVSSESCEGEMGTPLGNLLDVADEPDDPGACRCWSSEGLPPCTGIIVEPPM